MHFTLVDRPQDLDAVRDVLRQVDAFALDCEAAGFHRYRDTLCLVQLSTRTENFILDPLATNLRDVLRGPLENPAVQVVMHGADFDMRLLDRDLSLRVRGLFDTQVAAALLGEPRVGLSALLETYLDVRLSKKHQRADWAARPLTPGMLSYAAADTAHLLDLRDLLMPRVEDAGRTAWVEEELAVLQDVRWQEEDDGVDPVTRVKKARGLPPRDLALLRTALTWRDELAREMDRAPFRVAGDGALLALVDARPTSLAELAEVKGMPARIVAREGPALLTRLEEAMRIPPDELEPYPRSRDAGPGRPTPEEEERFELLKAARNRTANALGLDRGRVFPNSALMALARGTPDSLPGLVEGGLARRWQVEVVGPALQDALGSE